MARRCGSTALGRVLDGLVDRLFIVAVYVPLCDRGIVPCIAVAVLLVRELAIRWLRGVLSSQGIPEEPSLLGKLKTTLQFVGAGFILLIKVMGESSWSGWLLALPPVIAIAFLVTSILRRRNPGPWVLWGPGFFGFVWAVRTAAGSEQAGNWIMAVIVAVSLAAAVEAIWKVRKTRMEMPAGLEFAGLAVGAFIVPAIFFPLIGRSGLLTLTAGTVLAVELTLAGIYNALPPELRVRGARLVSRPARLAVVGASLLVLSNGNHAAWMIAVPAVMLIGAEVIVMAIRFRRLARVEELVGPFSLPSPRKAAGG